MIARNLHHTSFPVRDLARARRFYGEVLELDEIERPDLGFPGAWYGVLRPWHGETSSGAAPARSRLWRGWASS